MNHLPYPEGAFSIAKARANGMRPSGPVIVAMHAEAPQFENATVIADPSGIYRWDWVRGLPSIVGLIGKDTRFGTILRDIEDSDPQQLDVIDFERELGWMVLFTKPRLRTVRWPQQAVRDWLGDGMWHIKLNELKTNFGLATV